MIERPIDQVQHVTPEQPCIGGDVADFVQARRAAVENEQISKTVAVGIPVERNDLAVFGPRVDTQILRTPEAIGVPVPDERLGGVMPHPEVDVHDLLGGQIERRPDKRAVLVNRVGEGGHRGHVVLRAVTLDEQLASVCLGIEAPVGNVLSGHAAVGMESTGAAAGRRGHVVQFKLGAVGAILELLIEIKVFVAGQLKLHDRVVARRNEVADVIVQAHEATTGAVDHLLEDDLANQVDVETERIVDSVKPLIGIELDLVTAFGANEPAADQADADVVERGHAVDDERGPAQDVGHLLIAISEHRVLVSSSQHETKRVDAALPHGLLTVGIDLIHGPRVAAVGREG